MDFGIDTYKQIEYNKARDRQKSCLMFNMTMNTDRNITTNECEKLPKCKDPEFQRSISSPLLTKAVTGVVGAPGMIKNSEKRVDRNPW